MKKKWEKSGKDRQGSTGFVKNLAAAVCIIGAASLAFQGAARIALGMENKGTEKVATSYSTDFTVTGKSSASPLPEGYTKPEYQLVDNDLEYYKDKKPTSADLTREEAAELGVQGLYRVFGLDMNGKVIEMAYNPAQNSHRATWEGSWWPDGRKSSSEAYVQSYFFSVDAISGELYSIIHDRVLSGTPDTGFDSKLNQNAGDYEALARETAVKLGAIKGSVRLAEYGGQGYTNNDPDICFNLTGEGGDRAQLRFSRYDRELLAVTFDAGMRDMDISEQEAADFAKRAEEYFRQNPGAESYEE